MIEAFIARHGADRPRLALDDRLLRALRGAAIGEIAIAVEEALRPSIQSEKKTLVTVPVMNSRIANMSPRIKSGGRISSI